MGIARRGSDGLCVPAPRREPLDGEPITSRSRLVTIPWYPAILAAAYVLTLWVETGVSVFAILRALAIATAGAGLLVIITSLIIRRPHVAGFTSLIIGAILVSRGTQNLLAVVVLAAAVPGALILLARIRRRALSAPDATRSLNGLGTLLVGVILIGGLPRGALGALVEDVTNQGSPQLDVSPRSPGGPPDIIVLLLDGYPRADSLQRLFGAQNDAFIESLVDRGFTVTSANQSNYPYTQATLTSMLHMQPLDTIPALDPVEARETDDYPLLRLVLNRNPVFDVARSEGYSVVVTSPGYEHVTLRHADVYFDDGSLNEFERHLIRATPIQGIIDAVSPSALTDQHRQRTLSAFEFYDELFTATFGPTFALVHVPSPHLPIVIDGRGEVLADPPPIEAYREEPIGTAATEAYLAQLSYLNGRTLDSLDRALASSSARDREPILVIMSDHGAAAPALPGGTWGPEHYANFFAIRWPEADASSAFGDDTSPVNLYPILFNQLFGRDLPTWPNEPYQWRSDRLAEEVLP